MGIAGMGKVVAEGNSARQKALEVKIPGQQRAVEWLSMRIDGLGLTLDQTSNLKHKLQELKRFCELRDISDFPEVEQLVIDMVQVYVREMT